MTIQHTPAPVRSDLPVPGPAHVTDRTTRHPFRPQGSLLTVGALAWAAGLAVYGLDGQSDVGVVVHGLGSGLFQVGLLGLLTVLYRTQALGSGRLARVALRVEAVLVALAIGSTLADAFFLSDLDQVGWAVLDAFWPFSMMGMAAIGVRVAVAGRWRGAARFWPLLAESWALVVIPSVALFGQGVATWVAVVHLCVGYAVLGQLVARKSA